MRLEEEKRQQRERESSRPQSTPQLSTLASHIGLSRAQASAFRPVMLSPPVKAPKNLKVQEYVNRTLFGGNAFGNQGNSASRTSNNTSPAMRQSINGLVLMGGDAFRKYEEKRQMAGSNPKLNSSLNLNRSLSSIVSPTGFDSRQSPLFNPSSASSVHNTSTGKLQAPSPAAMEYSTPVDRQQPALSPQTFPRTAPKPSHANQATMMPKHQGGISPDIFSRQSPVVASRLDPNTRRNSVDNLSARPLPRQNLGGGLSPRNSATPAAQYSTQYSAQYSPRYAQESKAGAPATSGPPGTAAATIHSTNPPSNVRMWREVREIKPRAVPTPSAAPQVPTASQLAPPPAVKQEMKPVQDNARKEYTIRTILQNGELVCVVEDA